MNKGRFQSPKLQGPAINERIKSKSVRVISEKGEMLGVYDVQDAVKLAFEQGLDLVEVSPNASPPVCKIIDYGKYKFELSKKEKRANKTKRKRHKIQPTQEEGNRRRQRRRKETDKHKINMMKLTRFLSSQSRQSSPWCSCPLTFDRISRHLQNWSLWLESRCFRYTEGR